MKSEVLYRFVVALFVIASVTACVSTGFYPDRSFSGLAGAMKSNGGTLNVVFVHGMGHHPFGEEGLLKYQERIARKLGFTSDMLQPGLSWGGDCRSDTKDHGSISQDEIKRIQIRRDAKQAVCELKINRVILGFVGWRQYASPKDGKSLNMFELSWDRATELLQQNLLELNDDYLETVELDDELNPMPNGFDRESDRVWLNRKLKKFVNQNLGDPAIYMGEFGNAIRRIMADGLVKIASAAGTSGAHDYSIISDSLGSRIVFDSLGCALDSDANLDKRCSFLETEDKDLFSTRMSALGGMANTTTQVFMNANQLPFLALSNVRQPGPGEAQKDWLKRFPCESGGPGLTSSTEDKKIIDRSVQIVAFTDPNDALSFHLTERFRRKCTHLGSESLRPVEFFNVRMPNVKWHFGIFANPYKAHSNGFRPNEAAIELLVNGHNTNEENKRF